MEELSISFTVITSNGVANIMRLLESTQLRKVTLVSTIASFTMRSPHDSLLRLNQFLKELSLNTCQLGDGGIHNIVDGLVGNTTMEVLDIIVNLITSNGLADCTRRLLLLETSSTQLKTIYMVANNGVFDEEHATQHFLSTLQYKNSSVQELIAMIRPQDFSVSISSNICQHQQQVGTQSGIGLCQFTLRSSTTVTTTTPAELSDRLDDV